MDWTRRDFIKAMGAAAAAAAAATTSGRLLFGCKASSEAGPLPPGSELRDMHFSLGHVSQPHVYTLHVGARAYPLAAHDAASRTSTRGTSPFLASVDDSRITHYAQSVPFPSNAVQSYTVRAPHPANDGRQYVFLAGIHVPKAARAAATSIRSKAALRASPPPLVSPRRAGSTTGSTIDCEGGVDSVSGNPCNCVGGVDKISGAPCSCVNGISPTTGMPCWSDEDVLSLVDEYDWARYIVFHHPELMSLDPVTAALVLQQINLLAPCEHSTDPSCANGPMDLLAENILLPLGAASSQQGGGWASPEWVLDPAGNRIPLLDKNRQPVVDASGNPSYTWTWVIDPSVNAAAGEVIARACAAVRNDPLLEQNGVNPSPRYYLLPGESRAQASAASGSSAKRSPRPAAPYTMQATHAGEWRWGQKVSIDGFDQQSRAVSFTVHNHWLRHLSVFVAFRDLQGNIIRWDNETNPDIDHRYSTGKIGYLGLVSCPMTIMGVPVDPDDGVSGSWTVQMQKDGNGNEAASLCILVGSMGGHDGDYVDDYSGVNTAAIVMTSIFELALPALLLAVGAAGLAASSAIARFGASMGAQLLVIGVQYMVEKGLDGKGGKGLVAQTATTFALNIFAKKAVGGLAFIMAEWFAAAIVEEDVEKGIPIVGMCMYAADVASTTAALAQTISETACAAVCSEVKVTSTHRIRVTVHHDPLDYQWPQTATKAVFTATADKVYQVEIDPLPTNLECSALVCDLPFDIPSGDAVTITVMLYSSTDWLAGQAQVTVPNFTTPDNQVETGDGHLAMGVHLCLKEHLVPLDRTTTYAHKRKLGVDAKGNRVWLPTYPATDPAPAPAVTAAAASCGSGAGLCEPGVITMCNATGQFAYSFQAASAQLSVKGIPASAGAQCWDVRNVNEDVDVDGQDPDATLQKLALGRTAPVIPLYSPVGAATAPAYLLAPNPDGVYHLRQVTMPTKPGQWGDPDVLDSWGQFKAKTIKCARLSFDGARVVALDANADKIEMLEIVRSCAPSAEADANRAASISGPGDQRGSISGAKSIAVSLASQAFLVLEQGNLRIQALDYSGNPAKDHFGKGVSWVSIHPEPDGSTPVLLDISVEAKGYVYVLSHTGSGTSANDYHLDLYGADGSFMSRTSGVAAARMTVDLWRNVTTVNYESLIVQGRVEPSVSEWIPSTPTKPTTDPNDDVTATAACPGDGQANRGGTCACTETSTCDLTKLARVP